MFDRCRVLSTSTFTSMKNWNISKVTSFAYMCRECKSHPSWNGTWNSNGTFTPSTRANALMLVLPIATPTDATPADATPTDATPSDATPSTATRSDALRHRTTPTDAERSGIIDLFNFLPGRKDQDDTVYYDEDGELIVEDIDIFDSKSILERSKITIAAFDSPPALFKKQKLIA